MNFTRKSRWVKNGYIHDPPAESTFSVVVSRETVIIFLTYDTLNDLKVMCCEVNLHTCNHHCLKKIKLYVPTNLGKILGVLNSLRDQVMYGVKFSGSDYCKTMRTCMSNLQFKPCQGEPDLWMKQAQKYNGHQYW